MEFLTYAESVKWAAQHGYEAPYVNGFAHQHTIRTPERATAHTNFVRNLRNLGLCDAECLILLDGFGNFSNTQNWELFRLVHAGFGQHRDPSGLPGHVVAPTEREFESILDIVLYFYWDAYVLDSHHRWMLANSHDEFIDFAWDADSHSKMDPFVRAWGED